MRFILIKKSVWDGGMEREWARFSQVEGRVLTRETA